MEPTTARAGYQVILSIALILLRCWSVKKVVRRCQVDPTAVRAGYPGILSLAHSLVCRRRGL